MLYGIVFLPLDSSDTDWSLFDDTTERVENDVIPVNLDYIVIDTEVL